MEALTGNFVFKTSLNLQRRLYLIPWMLRSRGICSASERAKNPSLPVRYVPKTSTKTDKSQTRKPMKGSDKKVITKGFEPNAVRCEVLNKRMVPEYSSALNVKPQVFYQGIVNELPHGSYQDELEEDAEELEMQQGEFPLSHDLKDREDKDDAEKAAIRLLQMRDKANDSSNPVRLVSTDSLELETDQTRPTPVKGSEMKVTKKDVDPNVVKFEVSNGRMVEENRFSDKKLQILNRCASRFSRVHQEANNEIKYDEETANDEYMEELEENAKELGVSGNYSLNQELQACENNEEAEKAAIRLLASRAYTAVELRKKLHGKRFPTSTIDAVVMDFQSRGLINDCFYAESYARSRWSSSSWGPRRVKQALRNKGVTEVDTKEALKSVYEDDDQDPSLGISKALMDQLYTQASKQWVRCQDISDETRKSRMIRWLQYRGFNWGVTSFILKKLESKHPS